MAQDQFLVKLIDPESICISPIKMFYYPAIPKTSNLEAWVPPS